MDKDTKYAIITSIFLIFLVLAIWLGASYFEMKSFNKFSKTKATLIDAMFCKLRIMAD